MMKKNKSFLFFVLAFAAIAVIFFLVYYFSSRIKNKIVDINPVGINDSSGIWNSSVANPTTEKTETNKEPSLPEKYLLSVPFQSQAPYGDWSEPYENACEEAAIVIVEHYLNSSSLSKDQMKSEIDAAVAWQMANWGGHNDLPAGETMKLARDYFGLEGKIIRNYQLEDLKKYISSGVPIIAPTAGRRLGNPNFRGAGPEYHMIVIIGYDDSQGIFITNDPGTRKGKSYVYKYQTVLSAISGPKENMEKAVIVLTK